MQTLWEIDAGILLWIQDNLRIGFLNPVMKFITSLANYGICWIALALMLLIIKKYRLTGLMTAVSMIINGITVNGIIKHIAERTRPYDVIENLTILIERQPDSSFPSGHTAISFATAVVVFRNCDKKIGIPALILAFLISASRLYVGVHYPSDVICGMIAGTLCALAGEFIVKKISTVIKKDKSDPS